MIVYSEPYLPLQAILEVAHLLEVTQWSGGQQLDVVVLLIVHRCDHAEQHLCDQQPVPGDEQTHTPSPYALVYCTALSQPRYRYVDIVGGVDRMLCSVVSHKR